MQKSGIFKLKKLSNLNLGLFSALLCIWGSAIISTNVNAAVPNYDSLKSELKAETRQFNKDIKASIKESDSAMDEIVDAAIVINLNLI